MTKNKSFLHEDRPLRTVMVQAYTPERIRELIDRSQAGNPDAFGMQFCKLKAEYRTPEIYRELFAYAGDRPVYLTNYRHTTNQGKNDETLAEELLEMAECGATLCDVMGDYFAPCEGELTMDGEAVKRQMVLIDALHERGAEVLMSSHVLKFIPAERVLEIALEHQRRGADICKIVTGASNMAEQMENLRIVRLLKETLEIPFLYLSGGESRVLRRIGGELGCCMYLCVQEYDEVATKSQPLLCEINAAEAAFGR
ncbi:MAG: type I 3-dehydroquinate dehydratase [Clostridia bacterium]|nr:type I 3-dehydroquinate dehydratase [Clostridia bacterium]